MEEEQNNNRNKRIIFDESSSCTRPLRAPPSSEEDSVAEMDYMSEQSGRSANNNNTNRVFQMDVLSQNSTKKPPPTYKSPPPPLQQIHQPSNPNNNDHRPLTLPKFRDSSSCMWTASHAANSPSEDRSASLVNILLQPLPPNSYIDSETQLPELPPDYQTLVRLNLWAVIDGHGGGCVATYGSEVLLPHIAANIASSLQCAILQRGTCIVNGQERDANALDWDGLIQTPQQSNNNGKECTNNGPPNSIQYTSPHEQSWHDIKNDTNNEGVVTPQTNSERKQIKDMLQLNNPSANSDDSETVLSGSKSDRTTNTTTHTSRRGVEKEEDATILNNETVSSVKTSVKTAVSNKEDLVGTHSPREVAAITRAITESFLAVDEGWINSIDPVATHQTSCQSNGRWNSGACALVVFTIQRLDWTSVSEPDREKEWTNPVSRRNTSQNRDAARRRMLDYASRTKSASSVSTTSSTSSLTTEEAVHASGIESEITETEGEDDEGMFNEKNDKRDPTRPVKKITPESLISPPGGCSCHCYRAHPAMIYSAHVGDCRAVLLGSAPPRTIKVRNSHPPDPTDDESSHHSSDETECLSSSDHDAESSEEEDIAEITPGSNATANTFTNVPRRVVRQKGARRLMDDTSGPYIALPPLDEEELGFETEIEHRKNQKPDQSDSSTSSQDSIDLLPLVQLRPGTHPIDLTTDHSAYNPAEVTAVLRRCNNAPRAISAGVGGGIKRVAGSLAVTRALGDAYLKTPLLSFLPYKSHAPYITARPEVNCRPLVKDGDKVLILATDGVWERASGEEVLRWVRNYYEERIAESERRSTRRDNKPQGTLNDDIKHAGEAKDSQQESSSHYLFEKNEQGKREMTASPVGNMAVSKRRKRSRNRIHYNVADVIVRRVLNKVRRSRNISSLQALMSLPPGRARRSKHDDITAQVVDLSAFVS